jgi:hypothetical protein
MRSWPSPGLAHLEVTVATEPWAPKLEEVAGHIPTRTRDASDPGSDALTGTFSDTTTPTESQAQRITDAAVATVAGAVGSVTTKLEPLARDAAGCRRGHRTGVPAA